MATAVKDFSNVTPNPTKPSVQFQTINTFSKDHPTPEENESPENWIREDDDKFYTMRPRSASHHLSSTIVPSRRWLRIQARILRACMAFAAGLPKFKAPKKTSPTFVRQVNAGPQKSTAVDLYFYTPPDYHKLRDEGHRFPIVVNFHGGGFCLGHATDDQHWARVVLKNVPCVVVSVNYRLAPEHPFPSAVDDAVDALLYLSANSEELGLDPSRIALSGFSAGANLVFSVPLRLEYHTKRHEQSKLKASSATNLSRWPSTARLLRQASYDPTTQNTTTTSSPSTTKDGHLNPFNTPPDSRAESPARVSNPNSSPTSSATPLLNLKIRTIVAWYPLLDWTVSRAEKKRTSLNPPKTLPKLFTDLFDYSYLPPPDMHGYHCSPYASPGLAPDHMLRDGLPADIQFWLCEWDMLLAEGNAFSKRLQGLGKNVVTSLVEAVPHGFDQSPSPWRDQAKIDLLYEKACGGLRAAFAE